MSDTPEKNETIEVPKEQWDDINARLRRLEATGDRGRLAAFDAHDKKPLERYVKLSTYEADGVRKVILAWKMIRDHVYKASNGAWVEDQVVEVIFEDNSKTQMSLADFYRKTQKKITCRIVKRDAHPETGVETFVLEGEDATQYVVSGAFVN